MRRWLLIPVCAGALSAQCVMCYRTSHAQQEARSRALNAGILVLGAPPFLILAGFVAYVFKRGNRETTAPAVAESQGTIGQHHR